MDNRLPRPLDMELEVVPTAIELFRVGAPANNLAPFVRSILLDLYFGRELFPILPANRLGLLLLGGVPY
jgi:hypothetical protein